MTHGAPEKMKPLADLVAQAEAAQDAYRPSGQRGPEDFQLSREGAAA